MVLNKEKMGLFSSSPRNNDYQNIASSNDSNAVPVVTASVAYPVGSPNPSASAPSYDPSAEAAAAKNFSTGSSGGGPSVGGSFGPTLGRHPASIGSCPYCHASSTMTRVRTYPSCETWVAFGIMILVFWPLCWIPLVMDSCKKTDHVCVNCNQKVGEVPPMSDICVTQRG